MHYVYVLRSQVNGRYYMGITSDPAKRLQQHNSGQTKSTKAYIPWELVCTVPCHTLRDMKLLPRKENSKLLRAGKQQENLLLNGRVPR